MHRLVELSGEIDSVELSPCVSKFTQLKDEPAKALELHSHLSTLPPATTKNPFLAALTESLAIFGDYSGVEPAVRVDMLKGAGESVQFYLNRILKEAKERGEQGKIEWVREFKALFDCYLQERLNASSGKETKKETNTSNTTNNQSTTKQTPVPTLQGNVWYLEGVKGRDEPVEVKIDSMQQRLVISKCSECVVRVSGKCTAVSLEQGTRVGLLVTDPIVSTLEVLNSTKCQVQLQQSCPTMTVDNCEGVQVFLGEGVEKQFELLTCKSNEVNLYRAAGEGFGAEIPVPEQFKSYFDSEGKLHTEPVKHAGA